MAYEPRTLGDFWGFTPAPGVALVAGNKVYPNSQDRRRLYKQAVGVDMLEGEGVDIVHDLANPLGFQVAHVDCCSLLEHCADPFAVARNLQDALRPGGTLLVSVPFCWRVHAYPSDFWRFTTEGVRRLFPLIEWESLQYVQGVKRMPLFKVPPEDKGRELLPKTEVVGWGIRV